ncbi:MAG TPA: NAD-glutamate dehydrogenase [Gammaproteobacteria bacterium]
MSEPAAIPEDARALREQRLRAIARAVKKPSPPLPVDPAAYLRAYYADAELEELEGDPAALAAAALDHLRFALQRPPGRAKVRVFNPVPERDGWASRRTVVQTVNDDMPFLVDSVSNALHALGHGIQVTIHPVLRVTRDRKGVVTAVEAVRRTEREAAADRGKPGFGRAPASGKPESLIHIEIARETQPAVLDAIERALKRTLRDVRAAVGDWPAMLAKLRAAAAELGRNRRGPAEDVEEARAFLDWLADDHFTLLGYHEYELIAGERADRLQPVPGTGLGILRGKEADSGAIELTGAVRDLARSNDPLVITKDNRRSTVHRLALLDHIGVKVFDERGRPRVERRFLGLFTADAYNENPRDIPLLRHKVARLMDLSGLDPLSHRGRTLQNILHTFPRDDLFQASIEELAAIAAGVLALQERRRVRLFCRRESFGRFFSCFVYLPRDQYNARARRRIEELLRRRFDGHALESHVTISESALARLEATVWVTPGSPAPDLAALERELAETVRTWPDRLRESLLARLPEERALELFHRYAEAVSAAYQDEVDAERAAEDLQRLERLAERELEMSLGPSASGRPERLRFTTFKRGDPIPLHFALPVLENMGFKVISERIYRVRPEGTQLYIQDFELEVPGGQPLDLRAAEPRFHECFARVLAGDADNDAFNGLVVSAGLEWREAALLRAYCRYILQSNLRFSQSYMQQVLGRFPAFCRALVDKFRAVFDPDLPAAERAPREAAAERVIADELERNASLDDDRILRMFAACVAATVRTNYFQTAGGRLKPYFSFKLDPRRIPELPRPLPLFEIFVYSQRVEGVHLRMARVARGGIRWSDRPEDFRTEILGLMKAQQVKNAVIVPSGAKGGFVCKQLPQGDRDAIQREVVACYKTFIRGLLDVTDNLVDGRPVTPDRVVARDEPDPYLVVAADKGTAAFSDIANALAAEYGFWLGDAFASGGSTGYDHKKMGITARGAWESVKRHFRELGIDADREPITVIGIGDMSGDVFGNGLLRSPHMKLIAAFDHRHIFVDPDPDPAVSYAERKRLFELPRSTWDDYDRSKLSPGGGIYSRHAKSIELEPAAQARLGLDRAKVTPPELIRAVLTASADLLWNGGIGTYVKASSESHADAADPANDSVRVDGRDLRCRVVAEGGNLGFTQLGRVEYALAGGRINTDFIDNSGGVDSSDREVNIKILLNGQVAAGKLTRAKRDALLAEMTEEIAALVLADNYAQTQALSMMSVRAAERLDEHARLVRLLEGRGLLDRSLEFLPTDEELEARRAAGLGLTRPELAVILSYSKIELRERLVDTDVPEDEYLRAELKAYFPRALAQRFGSGLRAHPLAREIVAMLIAGSMINRMGPFFVLRAEEETGADVAQVARAYAVAREVFGVRALWREIEGLDHRVPAAAQYDSIFQISRYLRRAVYWLLQNYADELDIEPLVQRFRPAVGEVFAVLPKLTIGRAEQRVTQLGTEFEGVGLPADLANRIAALALMPQSLDIVELARELALPAREVGELYFALGEALGLDWIRERIEALAVRGRWRAMARATLRETLAQQHRALLRAVLGGRGRTPPRDALARWLDARAKDVTRVQRSLDEIRAIGEIDFATLAVALKEVGRLV